MMYIIVLALLVLLVAYLTWLWLSAEMRDAVRAARVAWRVRRGGRTPSLLVEEACRRFWDEGLEADFVIVTNEALDLYDRLRERVIGRTDRPDLPAAIVLALGIDVDGRMLYLRSVDTPAGASGRETAGLHPFGAVVRIETVANDGPEGLVPPGEQALAIDLGHGDPAHHRLVLEPGWHLSPRDVANRIRAMVLQREPPAGAPVYVR